jgi:flavorubredoxin
MKVQISQSVDIETEVDITTDDITAALDDQRKLIKEQFEDPEMVRWHRNRDLLGFAADLVRCLKSITDEMIAGIGTTHREIIANELQNQADRYRTASQEKSTL